MAQMIFVNLPVSDVARSTAFYQAIGFEIDPRYSNEQGSGMIWSDTIYFMLLSRPFYSTFTSKPIAHANAVSAALYALSFNSREAVDAVTEAAIAAGGREVHPPEDHGWMYSRAFADPDGHGFGPFWMDIDAALAATNAPQQEPA
ncbi:VOC family protein [Sphingomonas sp. CJ99]